VSHPGEGFARRSSHTVSLLECPRKAYLSQLLALRVTPDYGGERGPLSVGKMFHTLLEIHYNPAYAKGRPLLGTDGCPVLDTPEEALDWFVDVQRAAESAADEAYKVYLRYCYSYEQEGHDLLADQIIGRPEPDVEADIRNFPGGPVKSVPVTYRAQYDAVARARPGRGAPGVMSVENKSLASFGLSTVRAYRHSGQILGQCAVWNSRPDLTQRFGTMDQVLLNLAFKGKNPERPVHREQMFINPGHVRRFTFALSAALDELEYRLSRDVMARQRGDSIADVWPMLGITRGCCARLVGFPCRYLSICETGVLEGEMFQITESGRARLEADQVVRVSGELETYAVPVTEAEST
jgi:hypothetical protein